MSEHMAAEIHIGGRIPAAMVPGLCQAIAKEVVSTEWGGGCFKPAVGKDLLDARENRDGVLLLCLYDDQARWGEFAELEQFLREHGIAYTRLTDPKYEFQAEMAVYRPPKGLITLATDPQHEPVIRACELSAVEKAISKLVCLLNDGKADQALRAARRAQRLLQKQLLPDVPPLGPFEIDEKAR